MPTTPLAPEPFDVEDVIGRVKEAIRQSNLAMPDSPTDLVVTALDLTLKVVTELGAGVQARFKVPWIGLELGAHTGRQWSTTNQIEISLEPPIAYGEAQGLLVADLGSDLARAISMVRSGIAAAAEGEPVFLLKNATVEIEFGVTRSGGLSLVATADAANASTQLLSLKLGRPRRPIGKPLVADTIAEAG
jgi:NTP-dependent ternary system trypsin peptidase co-occuring protein